MNKIFILVIIATLILPISLIYGEPAINDSSEIKITMDSGFGFKLEICNEGNTSIENINLTLLIDIPLILGGTTQMTISELSPGDCITIGPILFLGLGPGNLTIIICYDDVTINQTFNVFLIGFFVIMI